jgi:hypothetical protein
MSYLWAGPPREFLQGETRLLWGPGDRSRLSYKSSIWGPIKPLVAFQNCFIFCAAECPDNIYFIQSSDKHNQLNSWKYQTNKRRKIQDKTSMANAMEPFRDSQIPSWLSGLRTNVPAETPSHSLDVYESKDNYLFSIWKRGQNSEISHTVKLVYSDHWREFWKKVA